MITDIAAFLKFFDGVNRRAVRDIGSLPAEAETWKPPAGQGERGWDVGTLVAHMAASRLYFASAYRGDGWIARRWQQPTWNRTQWVAALDQSCEQFADQVSATPQMFLTRRVDAPDIERMTFSGWRVLMMMVEHDIHHRSQIDTYAGIMGWPVQQIFGRMAEDVGLAPD